MKEVYRDLLARSNSSQNDGSISLLSGCRDQNARDKLGKPHQTGEILAASPMARIIHSPTRIQAEGQPPKIIEEFFGRVNSGTFALSIARMVSPSGWSEPAQTPSFDEFTVVLRGRLQVETRDAVHQLSAGQALDRSTWIERRDYALLLAMLRDLRVPIMTGLRDQDLTETG